MLLPSHHLTARLMPDKGMDKAEVAQVLIFSYVFPVSPPLSLLFFIIISTSIPIFFSFDKFFQYKVQVLGSGYSRLTAQGCKDFNSSGVLGCSRTTWRR
jgi:hypothetical protein